MVSSGDGIYLWDPPHPRILRCRSPVAFPRDSSIPGVCWRSRKKCNARHWRAAFIGQFARQFLSFGLVGLCSFSAVTMPKKVRDLVIGANRGPFLTNEPSHDSAELEKADGLSLTSTPKGKKFQRHWKRYWFVYLVGNTIFLAIFLPILYVFFLSDPAGTIYILTPFKLPHYPPCSRPVGRQQIKYLRCRRQGPRAQARFRNHVAPFQS